MTLDQLRLLSREAAAMLPFGPDIFPPSIYYRFLYLLAQRMQPQVSLELGVCGGGGSYHLCLGAPLRQVVGVDIRTEYPAHIQWIKEHCSNFHFMVCDSIAAPELVMGLYGPISLAFIDTIHTYEHTKAEWEALKPCLAPGAVVCFDDLFREGMPRIWKELPDPKIRLDSLHIGGSPTDGGFGCVIWEK